MRRLIINADDFGLTGGVNRAIVECHRAGTVTSATLMANSVEFAGAVDLARAYPKLSVGCHVVLVAGQPLLPPAEVRSLLRSGTPMFRRTATDFARAAIRKQISADEIAAEALAQMRKLKAAGVQLTHFDTHKHTHIFPVALKALLRAAKECGVAAIRNPFTALQAIDRMAIARQPKLWLRYLQVKMLNRYGPSFRSAVTEAGLRTTDGIFGVIATGLLDEKILRAILDSIPEGTWELVCHPGYNDASLAGTHTRLRESRVIEREVLTAPQLRDETLSRGIELITFRDV